jgi:hypothetical protein
MVANARGQKQWQALAGSKWVRKAGKEVSQHAQLFTSLTANE